MRSLAARIRGIPSWQITLGVALLLLGFLIAAQLAAEGPRVQYASQERTGLVDTAQSLQSQQDQLKDRIVALRDQIQTLEGESAGSQTALRTLNDELERARIAAGLIPLTGSGIVLKLEDSTQPVPPDGNAADYLVGAADLRTVVDQLWLSGAEAVAINDERVVGSTAIIDIGGSVLVNAAYLAGPYQVSAIGPPELFSRLSASPEFQEFVSTRRGSFGIGISWAEPASVDIPAFAGSVNLSESRAVPSPSPSGGSGNPAPPGQGSAQP
jgi:uncharacterized protein YlxW (UPF0749 family)